MYKKNNGSTEQEILQNQFSAYVKRQSIIGEFNF